MHKVETLVLDALEEFDPSGTLTVLQPMRNYLCREELHLSATSHALGLGAVFHSGLEQDLEAYADAQHGTPARDPAADEADAVHGFQFAHYRFEGAHAGNNESVGVQHVLRLGAEDDLCPRTFECTHGGAGRCRTHSQALSQWACLRAIPVSSGGRVNHGAVAEDLRSQGTLGGRDAFDPGIGLHGGAQCTGERLELCLDNVVRVPVSTTFMCRQMPACRVMASKTWRVRDPVKWPRIAVPRPAGSPLWTR